LQLIQAKVDVNYMNRSPESKGTALHEAVYEKEEHVVEMLLKAGANPFLANRYMLVASSLNPCIHVCLLCNNIPLSLFHLSLSLSLSLSPSLSHTHTHTHTHTHKQAHTQSYTLTHTLARTLPTHIHTLARMQTHAYTRSHTYTHPHAHTRSHARKHTISDAPLFCSLGATALDTALQVGYSSMIKRFKAMAIHKGICCMKVRRKEGEKPRW